MVLPENTIDAFTGTGSIKIGDTVHISKQAWLISAGATPVTLRRTTVILTRILPKRSISSCTGRSNCFPSRRKMAAIIHSVSSSQNGP